MSLPVADRGNVAWIWIGLGGAVGTLLRYGLGLLLADRTLASGWPLGTLAANGLGSFLLAVVIAAFDGAQIGGVDARLVLGVGVLGGFTTYSSFNLETIALAQEGHVARAAAYVSVTVVACLVAGILGTLAVNAARGAS
jgi:CrcB protein